MVLAKMTRMALVLTIIALSTQAGQVPSRFVMGTNFSGICDWGTEQVWKD